MGREVKIVSLDFDWFEKKQGNKKWPDNWFGYVLPIYTDCQLCDGEGNIHCSLCYGDGRIHLKIEPPKSWDDEKNGYQIWQDVSEGGPVSPVFKKPEDLAKWMVENDDSITRGTSYTAWLNMIKKLGSCPSGIMTNGKLSSGMAIHEKE